MALKPCRECKTEISTSAKTCPHCGVKWPSGGYNWNVPVGLFIVIALMILGASISSKDGSTSAASEKANPTCVGDWTKCKDNSGLANHWSGSRRVAYDCKDEANKLAKYGEPKWSWITFGSFYPAEKSVETGVFTKIDDDVQFHNGFGAWGHAEVVCKYDLRQKKVLNVTVRQR